MNARLAEWNALDEHQAMEAMLACCGSRRWARAMVALRPLATLAKLSEEADRLWSAMEESDWMEAFACHPRIGERRNGNATGQSAKWSQQEQACSVVAGEPVLMQLAEGNRQYEERFGFTYIVCATGKSAAEMLATLNRRLTSDRSSELREAAEQQRQIMQIRLGKWLVS
ncbi:MAG TPA: 2-oxo-4-hydroxy-4-carboxy-5-ureidoimidazoline decarboxylase [Terracidiphilus sp.]|nr:2-oxo-4-hydroxy-4-carboxy-5-ureidoimidazoline decarboxylase [Terracidiphilus sp.]